MGRLAVRSLDQLVGKWLFFFFQAEDGIRDWSVTGVQTCALPISPRMMFCGGAVRLRCGQCASQESAACPERIEAAYDISNSLTNLLLCSWRPPGGQQALTNDDALARPRRFRRDWAASPEWNQGPGEESCPGHRQWTGPDLSHRHPQQRKGSEIQGCAACRNREELRDACDRWWRPASWRRRSSVSR